MNLRKEIENTLRQLFAYVVRLVLKLLENEVSVAEKIPPGDALARYFTLRMRSQYAMAPVTWAARPTISKRP